MTVQHASTGYVTAIPNVGQCVVAYARLFTEVAIAAGLALRLVSVAS